MRGWIGWALTLLLFGVALAHGLGYAIGFVLVEMLSQDLTPGGR